MNTPDPHFADQPGQSPEPEAEPAAAEQLSLEQLQGYITAAEARHQDLSSRLDSIAGH